MVTTTTTLPASEPIADASSGERVRPKAEEADMGDTHSAPQGRLRQARFRLHCGSGAITRHIY